jgi:hypothetical protein
MIEPTEKVGLGSDNFGEGPELKLVEPEKRWKGRGGGGYSRKEKR